jgi:calcineurin-like phosphoesterase family protein
MTEVLIENWNSRVKEDDVIFHMGDLFLCSAKNAEEISKRLNGRKHLIIGNHDRFSKGKYEKMGFKVHNFYMLEGFFLSHHPQNIESLRTAKNMGLIKKNICGHAHSKIDLLEPSLQQCVSVELTNYKPISLDFLKENTGHQKMK